MAGGSLLTADAPGVGAALGGPQWGIWDQNGQPLLPADATADVEFAQDYRISDYPQEEGAFASYNKVQVPYQAKVGFFISQQRADFLQKVKTAVASLDFVTVWTPEIQYPSANLTHYSYRRDSKNGVTLIRVEVWCEEVRVISGITSQSTQSTNGTSPTTSGQNQTTPTTQTPPPAAAETTPGAGDGTVGGNFPAADPFAFNNPDRAPGQGTIDILNDRNAADAVPAGIPNATGGGASALQTDLGAVAVGSAGGLP